MKNSAYVIVYWDGNHTVREASIVKIFYDQKPSIKFFTQKINELRLSGRFTSNDFLYNFEVPVKLIDEDDIESYIGKPATKEMADYLIRKSGNCNIIASGTIDN